MNKSTRLLAPTGTLVLSTVMALGGCGTGAEPSAMPTSPPTTIPTSSPSVTAASATPTMSLVWEMPTDAALPAPTVTKLQALLDGWVGTNGVPGLSAAVVSPSGSWAGAAGVDAAGKKVEPSSAFGIGSITKTFTAAEVLLLAAQGRIDLDAPVTQYVDLPFETHGATIRQLGTMTCGFPGFPPDATLVPLAAKDLDRIWTAQEIVALARDEPPMGTLGGPSAYNGIPYLVLGMVVEKVTGQPLAAAIRRDLLAPAGLERVWVQPDEEPQAPLTVAADSPIAKVVDTASGYLPSVAAASMGRGAAGIAGDAPSLARWGYLLYGGGLIGPTNAATMMSGDPSSGDGYGFGTMLGEWDGVFNVGHAGDWMGYSSLLFVWPDASTVVVVLAPRQGMAVDGTLGEWVTALYEVVRGS
jgi:D-alanyl-D-alanine carboxypeptidase